MYREIYGNLITLAQKGEFDVIGHGCNCFCRMGAGIAPQMAKAFGVDKLPLESEENKGLKSKLGKIDYVVLDSVIAVNIYSQYNWKQTPTHKPLDLEALTKALKEMNEVFKGKHIGLPQIGCGLAGGNWEEVREIIKAELKDCEVTIVIFKN